jgi:hypothetical protein
MRQIWQTMRCAADFRWYDENLSVCWLAGSFIVRSPRAHREVQRDVSPELAKLTLDDGALTLAAQVSEAIGWRRRVEVRIVNVHGGKCSARDTYATKQERSRACTDGAPDYLRSRLTKKMVGGESASCAAGDGAAARAGVPLENGSACGTMRPGAD